MADQDISQKARFVEAAKTAVREAAVKDRTRSEKMEADQLLKIDEVCAKVDDSTFTTKLENLLLGSGMSTFGIFMQMHQEMCTPNMPTPPPGVPAGETKKADPQPEPAKDVKDSK